jgi:hypothetical protein
MHVRARAANFTPSLAFVYYMSSDFFVFAVCGLFFSQPIHLSHLLS